MRAAAMAAQPCLLYETVAGYPRPSPGDCWASPSTATEHTVMPQRSPFRSLQYERVFIQGVAVKTIKAGLQNASGDNRGCRPAGGLLIIMRRPADMVGTGILGLIGWA
jgi:hypothetical protein